MADLLILTCAAGMMDALSYLRSGVFTANMTGNSVVLGLALVGPDRSRALACAAALGAFGAGALIAGWFLVRRNPGAVWKDDLRVGLALELPFAIAFTLLSAFAPPGAYWVKPALIGTAACALGIQSVAVRQLKTSGVVTTFITGTITSAIVALVRKSKAESGSRELGSPGLLAAMFVCYVLSAAAGVALVRVNPPLAASVPTVAIAAAYFRARAGDVA